MEAECEQSYLLACELDGRTLLGGCCVAVEVGAGVAAGTEDRTSVPRPLTLVYCLAYSRDLCLERLATALESLIYIDI